MILYLKKLAFFSWALIFFLASPILCFAADDSPATANAPAANTTTTVGPQSAVGTVGPTGPQAPTGNISPTGPQAPTGPQEATGPQPQEAVVSNSNDSTLTNNQTGPNSENENAQSNDSSTNVDSSNDADIKNSADLNIDTGNNEIGHNTVVGSVSTGDIDGSTTIINTGNSVLAPGSSAGVTNLAGGSGELVLVPSNDRLALGNGSTGPNSENSNSFSGNNTIEVQSNNSGNVENSIEVQANTGKNEISNNTKVGDISTGDVNLNVNLINLLNNYFPNLLLNLDVWNILGNYNGDIVVPMTNSITGPGSENTNKVELNNDTDISVVQNADLSNDFNFKTNTGNNNIGSNTAVSGLETGNTNINGSITNIANALDLPVYYIFNVYGQWDGSLLGLNPNQVIVNQINDLTGPGSENKNSTSISNDKDVNITNNAKVANKINIDANTGDNTISNNSIVGKIKTGAINIAANVVNIVNSLSEKVGKFALGIINIFGNWNGNAKSTAGGSSGSSTRSTKSKIKIAEEQNENIKTSTENNATSSSEDGSLRTSSKVFFSKNSKSHDTTLIAGETDSQNGSSGSKGISSNIAAVSKSPAGFALSYFIITGAIFLLTSVAWLYLKIKSKKLILKESN